MNERRVFPAPEVLVLGAAICDIPVCPVSAQVFETGSYPVERITLTTGGDAFNEAVILNRLGHPARLLAPIGQDLAGDLILQTCEREGLDTGHLLRIPGLDTGINIVLVTEDGERSFLTSRTGSLRALTEEEVMGAVSELSVSPSIRLVTFASMFVCTKIRPSALARIFRALKEEGRILAADMTRCKNHETLDDLSEALSQVDYLFPNREEAALLCGQSDPGRIADAFLSCGVGTLVLKLGASGCLMARGEERIFIPACPDVPCLDTTGAGDNFAAAFLAALLEGKDPADCARYACAASALCITETGAVSAVKSAAQVRHMRDLSYPDAVPSP